MSEPRRHHESLGRVNKRLAELWEAAGSQPIIHKPPSIPLLLLLLLGPYDWVGVWCFLVARRGPTNSTKANAQDYKVHPNRILCVDSLRCLFSLSHLLFTSPHMRRPVLQTKIGRQEYRKDSFCLGVGRWGGIRTQKKKTNWKKRKEKRPTHTHTRKKLLCMDGPFINAVAVATSPNFGSPPARLATSGHSEFPIKPLKFQIGIFIRPLNYVSSGFLPKQSTDKEKTSHRPPITKPFFGGKKEKVKLTTSHFCQKILMVCLIESVVCKVSGEGDRLFLGLW